MLGFFFFSENAQHIQNLRSWCPGNDKRCINICSKTSCHQAVELLPQDVPGTRESAQCKEWLGTNERARTSRVVTNSNKNFWQSVASGFSLTMFRRRQIIPHVSFFSSPAKELKHKISWGLAIIICRSFPPFCCFPQLQLSEPRGSVPSVTQCGAGLSELGLKLWAALRATPLRDNTGSCSLLWGEVPTQELTWVLPLG